MKRYRSFPPIWRSDKRTVKPPPIWPKIESMTLLFEASLQNTGVFTLIEQVEAANILEAPEYSLGDCADELCAIEIGLFILPTATDTRGSSGTISATARVPTTMPTVMSMRENGLIINQSVGGYMDRIVQGSG